MTLIKVEEFKPSYNPNLEPSDFTFRSEDFRYAAHKSGYVEMAILVGGIVKVYVTHPEFARILPLLTGDARAPQALPADVTAAYLVGREQARHAPVETVHFSYDAGYEEGPEWAEIVLPKGFAVAYRQLRVDEVRFANSSTVDEQRRELIDMLGAYIPVESETGHE